MVPKNKKFLKHHLKVRQSPSLSNKNYFFFTTDFQNIQIKQDDPEPFTIMKNQLDSKQTEREQQLKSISSLKIHLYTLQSRLIAGK